VKVLIVEDEARTADFLRAGLSEEGFALDVARNSDEAEEAVAVNDYDLVLLDVMLPGENGFTLCQRWRERGLTTPIIFLTARDEVEDRIQGLNLGGDDYLVKPFSFGELVARIRANLRRSHAQPAPNILLGDLVIETSRKRALLDGKPIPLTAREYQLLEYLAHHCGTVVTRAELWEHVWESGGEPDSNVVDVYIRYLRNKLGHERIQTLRGMGYLLRNVEKGGEQG
jgi:DNA-binding response OmpR family regulator